jgi:O-acetyl-ADP-ribose deacetylase (regulator of RNase III)
MLHFSHGNLLHAETEAVVNTVNTVGVMGKGIALAFKEAYPENFRAYEAACRAGELQVGRMFVTENRSLLGLRWISTSRPRSIGVTRRSWSGYGKD